MTNGLSRCVSSQESRIGARGADPRDPGPGDPALRRRLRPGPHTIQRRNRIDAPRIALLSLGGAVARVPGSATAFGGRGAEWLVQAGAAWDDESGDAAAQSWIEQLHVAVAGDTTGISYVNMLADERPAYSPWTRARLRAVKAAWDAENLFRRV